MKALVIQDGVLNYITDYPDPTPAPGQVLIDVSLAGICQTDLELLGGYMDFSGVPGHEFIGTVSHGPADLIGKRVTGRINCVCGTCDMCQSGLSNHCRSRTVLGISGRDGVFADRVSLPEQNVVPVPDVLDDDKAVFIEPLAAAFQAVQQVRPDARQKILVLGDGRLGLLVGAVMSLAAGPGNLTVVGKHPEKLTWCEKRGIQTMLVGQIPVRNEWDLVVDCTGSASGFAMALAMTRPRGTVVLKSTFVPRDPIDLSPLVVNEITLVGSRCGPFDQAVDALAAGRVDPSGLITSRYKLADGAAAFARAADDDQLKVVLDVARS